MILCCQIIMHYHTKHGYGISIFSISFLSMSVKTNFFNINDSHIVNILDNYEFG